MASGNFAKEFDKPKVFFLEFKPQAGAETRNAVAIAKSPQDACERLRRQFKGVQVIDCSESDDFPAIGPEVVDSILAVNAWSYINHQVANGPLRRNDRPDEQEVPAKKLERVFL